MNKDILIVDDEEDIRQLIAGILQDEGFNTRLAWDYNSIKKEISKRIPALLLLTSGVFHPIRRSVSAEWNRFHSLAKSLSKVEERLLAFALAAASTACSRSLVAFLC